MKKLAAVVALLSVFGLGMSFALLGSIKLSMIDHVHIDNAQFGTLASVFMFSCAVMSLIVGLLCDKWGYKPIAILGFVVTSVCFLLFAYATSFTMAMIACILLGVGAMCCNTAGNTLIPVVLFEGKNPAAASNFGNVFFGLGAFITPFIASELFKRYPESYSTNVTVLAVIVLLPVIVALLAQYPTSSAGFQFSQGASLLTQGAVIIAGLTLFLYIAIEMSMNNWITSLGSDVIKKATPGMPENDVIAKAGQMMMTFNICMMVGRLISSQVKVITKVGDKVIACMAAIIALVVLAMTKSSSTTTVWVLIGVAGLACASCFPTIVGVTFSKFNPKVYGSVFGIIFAIGLLGAVLINKVIGSWATGRPVQGALVVLVPVAAILIFLALILGKVKAKGDVAAK